jgi:hypothetical protein
MEPDRRESIVSRISKEQGVDRAQAERQFEGVLQFLELAASTDERLTPPQAIDAAWHSFILHTKDYAEYCQEHFGRFIHHRPNGGGNERELQTALSLAERHLERVDPTMWRQPASAECSSTCDAND